MSSIVMLKGLPASGKTTWAKQQTDKKRINKDDLRGMFDAGKWSKTNEKFVLEARNVLISLAINSGHSVIVDDTNLHPKHEMYLKELATNLGVQFKIRFFDTPVNECIFRDLHRPNSVGKRVILDMYNRYLAPTPPLYNPELPDAVLCDLDGTLCLYNNKDHFERDFSRDVPSKLVLEQLVWHNNMDRKIIFLSGRSSKFKDQTVEWLERHVPFAYESLHMRPNKDNVTDWILKKQMYESQVKDKYNVVCVIDDRPQVVRFWRSIGLFVFEVNQRNTEF